MFLVSRAVSHDDSCSSMVDNKKNSLDEHSIDFPDSAPFIHGT